MIHVLSRDRELCFDGAVGMGPILACISVCMADRLAVFTQISVKGRHLLAEQDTLDLVF